MSKQKIGNQMSKQKINASVDDIELKQHIKNVKTFRIDSSLIMPIVFGFAIYEHINDKHTWVSSFASGFSYVYIGIVALVMIMMLFSIRKLQRDAVLFPGMIKSINYTIAPMVLFRMILPIVLMFAAGFHAQACMLAAVTFAFQGIRIMMMAPRA